LPCSSRLTQGFSASEEFEHEITTSQPVRSTGLSGLCGSFEKSGRVPQQTNHLRAGRCANTVIYIQKGSVKFTVVNESGKEAVVAIFGSGDFFGEGAVAGESIRLGTATAVVPTTVLMIGKKEMIRVLHSEHLLSDRFITYMLARNSRVEADLVDQLFNSTEKRLARTLLLLARYGKEDEPEKVLQKISQETIAEMIGTTRSRVNFFMNKFRKYSDSSSTTGKSRLINPF
jgi:CRP/FNR family transcriptional regulator, cyclic AMP receptor protein